MKRSLLFLVLMIGPVLFSMAQRVENFALKDANSGSTVSLDQLNDKRGTVLIFTSNTCPFSKLYEDRIKDIASRFSNDFSFALINPHAGSIEETENEMKGRSFRFPYLMDGEQKVTRMLQASKLPEVFVITSGPTGQSVVYQGAIDNNPQAPGSVSQRYLENALTQIQRRSSPSPSQTRAVGCNIRSRSARN
ncbi:redoxin domain-containing protein [Litoribacter populi]|uniref:redoxin domain-containing protein n=1 Tax=Litoribacter populi TaxID=2598460 RepID=UPI00117BF1A0|nr:redoxin domain-containing protein [Litoribacter populi]